MLMVSTSSKHPLVEDFLQQYPSCDEDAAERAFLVYQDLTEVKGWWNTELAYQSEFEWPYVLGQRSRSVPRQAVIPMGVEEKMSVHEIEQFFSGILVDEEPIKNLTLAVNSLDSTVVYYKLTSGLAPPDAPEVVAERRRERDEHMERKRRHVASCVRQAMDRYSGRQQHDS